MKYKLINIVIAGLLISSCATKLAYNNSAPTSRYVDKHLEVKIAYPKASSDCTLDPILGRPLRCKNFTLTIKNKSNKDFFIDWNKSYYLHNNQAQGGFYFNGVVIKDRAQRKANALLLAKSNYMEMIYPNNLTYWDAGWWTDSFPLGNNGIYLTLLDVNNKPVKIKLSIPLRKS